MPDTDDGQRGHHQVLYAKSIVIEGMGSFDVRKVSSQLDLGIDVSPRQENGQELHSSSFPCTENLGMIMFLTGMNQPGTSCSARKLSRRVTSPCMQHWRRLHQELRYLPGTLDVSINTLVEYPDADWGQDKGSRRSTTGYL